MAVNRESPPIHSDRSPRTQSSNVATSPGSSGESKTSNHQLSAALVIGSIDGRLTASDRAATALAVTRFSREQLVYVGCGDESALRYALAAGCSRAVARLEDCRAETFLLGYGGAGVDADAFAAQLALKYTANLVLEVLDFTIHDGIVQVERDLGRGVREMLHIAGPVVLLVSGQCSATRYVSRFQQAAVRLPPNHESANTLKSRGEWTPLRPRTRTAELKKKSSGDAQSRMFDTFGLAESSNTAEQGLITADAETCARYLVRYLAHHGFISARPNDDSLDRIAPATTQPQTTLAATAQSSFEYEGAAARAPRRLGVGRVARYVKPWRPPREDALPAGWARAPRPLGGARYDAICRRPRSLSFASKSLASH